jgi:hypothetical protein
VFEIYLRAENIIDIYGEAEKIIKNLECFKQFLNFFREYFLKNLFIKILNFKTFSFKI